MQMHERPALPRRALLAGLAASPAAFVMAGATTAALAAPAPPAPALAQEVSSLWHAYLGARGTLTAASAEEDTAVAALPWWAKSGPSYIDHLGQHVGGISGMPAIQDMAPPTATDAFRLIRPDETRIRDDYKTAAMLFGGIGSRRVFDQRMSDLNQRRAAQTQERLRVGLPQIQARCEAACDVVFDSSEAIRNLPRGSAAAVAAQILVTLVDECETAATAEGHLEMAVAAMTLDHLLPSLTGELAFDAGEFVRNTSRQLKDMRVSRGSVA